MFNSAILEVATGIVFIYLLLSLMCTALREGIEGFLRTRASYLESGIRELLFDAEGTNLAKSFYEHPLIYSLYPGKYTSPAAGKTAGPLTKGNTLPSYIPAGNFAAALVDIVARGPGPLSSSAGSPNATPHPNTNSTQPITIADVRQHLQLIQNLPVQRAVLAALDTAEGDLEKAKKNLEHWYDSAMDRVSGRYKRSTQGVLFWIGLFIAVGFNIDTISLADYLYRNETQRGAIVAQAGVVLDDKNFLLENYDKVKDQIENLQLPIGWDFLFKENAQEKIEKLKAEQAAAQAKASSQNTANAQTTPSGDPSMIDRLTPFWNSYHAFFMKPLGWLLTAFAITLGAPFWFDLLNKIMIIRSTVKPHEKSPEEASEDRQTSSDNNPRSASAPTTIQIVQPGQPISPIAPAPASDSDEDGCDAAVVAPTADNELPAAQGGVS
jgi:hypothetical protein